MRAQNQLDPVWWTTGEFHRRPMLAILRDRDFTSVFNFLRTRGWSRSAIAAATGLSENRVRAISNGQQRITSYEVLERVAGGLRIDRGFIGLAYTATWDAAGPDKPACPHASGKGFGKVSKCRFYDAVDAEECEQSVGVAGVVA